MDRPAQGVRGDAVLHGEGDFADQVPRPVTQDVATDDAAARRGDQLDHPRSLPVGYRAVHVV